ncbi:MAG: tRNA pseudouridine(13) synthase TruD [Deinococcales bacterium]
MSGLPPVDEEALRFRWSALPLATEGLEGVGGRIRARPEDFRVEEVPAYLPQGSGSHLYLKVEKRNLTTRDLVVALMREGLRENEVGVAGLKDKSAVTVQWLSVPKRYEAETAALEALPGVTVLERSYHRNKLAVGHLRGNRFVVRIREVEDVGAAAARARAAFTALASRGAPNYFGPQRFGRFGNNAVDGLKVIVGEKVPGGHRLRRFFVSALQSLLFNALLADRIEAGLYQRVVTGDWARKHDTGGVFLVEDGQLESPRAARLEISATLPLYGRKVRLSEGEAGALEARVLERFGLGWSAFGSRRGDRRPSRVVLEDVDVLAEADALTVAFTLPKGSYATVVLRELMKVDVDAPLVAPEGATRREDDGTADEEDDEG